MCCLYRKAAWEGAILPKQPLSIVPFWRAPYMFLEGLLPTRNRSENGRLVRVMVQIIAIIGDVIANYSMACSSTFDKISNDH